MIMNVSCGGTDGKGRSALQHQNCINYNNNCYIQLHHHLRITVISSYSKFSKNDSNTCCSVISYNFDIFVVDW